MIILGLLLMVAGLGMAIFAGSWLGFVQGFVVAWVGWSLFQAFAEG